MVNRASAVITGLSGLRLALFIAFAAFAAFGVTKLLFRLPIPVSGVQIPDYGIAIGAVILVIGLFGSDIRGLAIAAGGATLAAISAIALLAATTHRWDAMLYGLPLALPGATGLAIFSHSILHARPSPARTGMLMVVWGFGLALAAFAYVLAGLLLRINVHGTQLGTISMAILTVAAVALAIASVVVGRKPPGGEGSGT